MTNVARLLFIAIIAILFISTGIWIRQHGRPRMTLIGNGDEPRPAHSDPEEEDPFDFSSPQYDRTCFGNPFGDFRRLAQAWNLTWNSKNLTVEKAERIRTQFGFPMRSWISDLDNDEPEPDESKPDVSVGGAQKNPATSSSPTPIAVSNIPTHLDQPHGCGTTQIQFIRNFPDGRQNFELEKQERSTFPTDFAAEILNNQVVRMWSLSVDGIPQALKGDELWVKNEMGPLCDSTCSDHCPSRALLYAVVPSGSFRIVAVDQQPVLPVPQDVSCPVVEELKLLQYDSCKEFVDQVTNKKHLLVYQTPCT